MQLKGQGKRMKNVKFNYCNPILSIYTHSNTILQRITGFTPRK